MYYSTYLQLDKVLSAQQPQSTKDLTLPAHDEMLFIIVHQAYELWFKQILHELAAVNTTLHQRNIDDNSEEMALAIHRLDRVKRIIRLLTGHMDVLDTMQPIDFLEFRALLTPASGFQSVQFREIEAMLGLSMNARHEPEHYKNAGAHKGGFTAEDHEAITAVEAKPTILSGLKQWLDRMPFLSDMHLADYVSSTPKTHPMKDGRTDPLMIDYYFTYEGLQIESRDSKISTLALRAGMGEETKTHVDKVTNAFNSAIKNFTDTFFLIGSGPFSPKEMRSALFITAYRHMPMLRLPYELITSLVEVDELLSAWRFRHFQIAMRMIGNKPGTGGSDGGSYLFGALQKNKVFADLGVLPTYYIARNQLPILPEGMTNALKFQQTQ